MSAVETLTERSRRGAPERSAAAGMVQSSARRRATTRILRRAHATKYPREKGKGMADQAREIISGPGEGRKVHVFGVVLTIRVASADAGGDFAVWEEAAPAGVGPPRHVHHRMDEAFQILEGHYQVWCDGRIHELGPGAMAMIPKGMPHTFRCVGPARGRMLTTVVPGGLDDFLIEIEARNFKLPDDLQQLMAMGARYGHEFIGPPLSD
jgi:mannose-6-phosphate isomerase-like protein (cupin superfamily)